MRTRGKLNLKDLTRYPPPANNRIFKNHAEFLSINSAWFLISTELFSAPYRLLTTAIFAL